MGGLRQPGGGPCGRRPRRPAFHHLHHSLRFSLEGFILPLRTPYFWFMRRTCGLQPRAICQPLAQYPVAGLSQVESKDEGKKGAVEQLHGRAAQVLDPAGGVSNRGGAGGGGGRRGLGSTRGRTPRPSTSRCCLGRARRAARPRQREERPHCNFADKSQQRGKPRQSGKELRCNY